MPDENKLYTHIRDLTVFTSEVDLQDPTPPVPAVVPAGSPTTYPAPWGARRIDVLDEGGGTLAVRFADGTEETFTIDALDIRTPNAIFEAVKGFTAILDTTDVGKVRVRW
jgi:hypothetical protein